MRSFIREKKIFCGKKYMEADFFTYTEAQCRASSRPRWSKKVRESEQKQKNLNDKNARRYFTQTAELNFGSDPEALHVSATYSNKYLPETVEDAEREVGNYLRRVQYKWKKEGLPPLKYMLVTAYTTKRGSEKPVRIHHHIIMNGGLDRDTVEELWRKRRRKGQKKGDRIGYCNADRLQADENGIGALCNYLAWVKRPGAAELLAWLETTDFFEAPASTKYHGVYPGGLVEHSLNVCRELASSSAAKSATTESLILCSLLHDVCKANYYAAVGSGGNGN